LRRRRGVIAMPWKVTDVMVNRAVPNAALGSTESLTRSELTQETTATHIPL
jgi:hypothetical protein